MKTARWKIAADWKKTALRCLKGVVVYVMCAMSVLAADFESPDILVLGDSQIPFGSGSAFLDFFSNLKERCSVYGEYNERVETLVDASVGVIGVRSTSLGSWIERHGENKNHICVRDKKWGVNAGVYGVSRFDDRKYVQIGDGEAYQFCESGQSAFETMFRSDYYDPKLLVLSFLGNSSKAWAEDISVAMNDVNEMVAQLPNDKACVFMTTQPVYKSKTVDLRVRAQENLQLAFEAIGSNCAFVPGATKETIASHQGNPAYFRRKDDGSVKDPFHPNVKAAKHFFETESPAICRAVLQQLERPDLSFSIR